MAFLERRPLAVLAAGLIAMTLLAAGRARADGADGFKPTVELRLP